MGKIVFIEREELDLFCQAVQDAYLGFDREDYCIKGMKRCGKCDGCANYSLLEKVYNITLTHYPEWYRKKMARLSKTERKKRYEI